MSVYVYVCAEHDSEKRQQFIEKANMAFRKINVSKEFFVIKCHHSTFDQPLHCVTRSRPTRAEPRKMEVLMSSEKKPATAHMQNCIWKSRIRVTSEWKPWPGRIATRAWLPLIRWKREHSLLMHRSKYERWYFPWLFAIAFPFLSSIGIAVCGDIGGQANGQRQAGEQSERVQVSTWNGMHCFMMSLYLELMREK